MIKGIYVYLLGWMVVGLCNCWGYLFDQLMYEKIVVVDLIYEIYVLLWQVDEVVINDLFKDLKVVKIDVDCVKVVVVIDVFESYVVLIIVDIDVGFGNEYVIYLLVKELIKVGVCVLQIENQVLDVK